MCIPYGISGALPLVIYGTAQLQLHYTMHGSPQCHGWLLLRGVRVPRLLALHERGTMQLFYALW